MDLSTVPTAAKRQIGFTLIELMLVLAIGGFIMALAFMALGQINMNKRNDQRKKDAATIFQAYARFQADHSGFGPSTPADLLSLETSYVNTTNFTDPSTHATYTVSYQLGTPPAVGTMYVHNSVSCSGGGLADLGSGGQARQYAVSVALEGGQAYCMGTSAQ